MPGQKTPRDFEAAEINETRADLNKPRDITADQLFAACTARAQLAIATAGLLDQIREEDQS